MFYIRIKMEKLESKRKNFYWKESIIGAINILVNMFHRD